MADPQVAITPRTAYGLQVGPRVARSFCIMSIYCCWLVKTDRATAIARPAIT